MHRYEELERLYYKRLYIKFFLIFVLIVIVSIAFYFFLKEEKSKKIENSTHKEKEVTKVVKKEINVTQVEKIKKVEKVEKKPKVEKTQELKFILPNIDFIEPVEEKVANKEYKKEKTVSQPIQKIKKIEKVEIKESSVNLNDLIKEYNKNKDYNLAITIAKIYLNKNDLKKAQIWALNANSLQPSKPESWVIFADILIKKKEIQKAKEILKTYINSYGSNNVIEEKLRSINGK